MKQILQDLGTGETLLAEVPAPTTRPGMLKIKTEVSLVSLGTEKLLLEFSKANWVERARRNPGKLQQVLEKIKTDGLFPALEAIRSKLAEPIALGYCNAGTVLEVGEGIPGSEFAAGDRVLSNGPHAELVCVPKHLCARIPSGVTNEDAVFAVVGAVALHGMRLACPSLGERFVVFGLGVIGLLAVQLLRANGCEVLGIDVKEDRLNLASKLGARVVMGTTSTAILTATQAFTDGIGVDGVLITASTPTDEVMHEAAEMCRKRGRIVLVGVVGLNLRRDDFYRKELSFQVSCSYGPGRYDELYEQGSQDYPLPYVRWTEQRNFTAVLDILKRGALKASCLITHRFLLTSAVQAYEVVQKNPSALGVLLEYPNGVNSHITTPVLRSRHGNRASRTSGCVVGVIGAGQHATGILLPALARTSARLWGIADYCPAAASNAANRFNFENATTDYHVILDEPLVTTVFIATRHSSHGALVCEALAAGKNVFVEKPLCLDFAELSRIGAAYESSCQGRDSGMLHLAVGFNRRFSPHILRVKSLLQRRVAPLCMSITINAGRLPKEHWAGNLSQGGERIIGEGCHFMDLLSFLAEVPVTTVSAMTARQQGALRTDQTSIQLGFTDGSIGVVNYFSNGSRTYPKERIEIFSEGRVAFIDNFRATYGFGFSGFHKFRSWRQDKGHQNAVAAFIASITYGPPLMPFDQIENVTRATFAAVKSATSGTIVHLPTELL